MGVTLVAVVMVPAFLCMVACLIRLALFWMTSGARRCDTQLSHACMVRCTVVRATMLPPFRLFNAHSSECLCACCYHDGVGGALHSLKLRPSFVCSLHASVLDIFCTSQSLAAGVAAPGRRYALLVLVILVRSDRGCYFALASCPTVIVPSPTACPGHCQCRNKRLRPQPASESGHTRWY